MIVEKGGEAVTRRCARKGTGRQGIVSKAPQGSERGAMGSENPPVY